MRESPRVRRLNADYEAIKQLDKESTVFSFNSVRNPPDLYHVTFRGVGVWRMASGEIALRDAHEVTIELAAAYPRLIPNLSWKTPIFHPNISSSGVVCLGGYGTNWVPSLTLDELCIMLWDMIRYKNYDTESPYNKDAAIWARTQAHFQFPLDPRSLRNQVSGETETGAIEPIRNVQPPPVVGMPVAGVPLEQSIPGANSGKADEIQIVEAVAVEPENKPADDILFID
jgi:ubiquitin-protein ligase